MEADVSKLGQAQAQIDERVVIPRLPEHNEYTMMESKQTWMQRQADLQTSKLKKHRQLIEQFNAHTIFEQDTNYEESNVQLSARGGGSNKSSMMIPKKFNVLGKAQSNDNSSEDHEFKMDTLNLPETGQKAGQKRGFASFAGKGTDVDPMHQS